MATAGPPPRTPTPLRRRRLVRVQVIIFLVFLLVAGVAIGAESVGPLRDAREHTLDVMRAELAALHDARLLELAEALGQDVGTGAGQTRSQVGEALRAEQQLADHQERPPLAHQVEGTRDPARVAVGSHAIHSPSITGLILKHNLMLAS